MTLSGNKKKESKCKGGDWNGTLPTFPKRQDNPPLPPLPPFPRSPPPVKNNEDQQQQYSPEQKIIMENFYKQLKETQERQAPPILQSQPASPKPQNTQQQLLPATYPIPQYKQPAQPATYPTTQYTQQPTSQYISYLQNQQYQHRQCSIGLRQIEGTCWVNSAFNSIILCESLRILIMKNLNTYLGSDTSYEGYVCPNIRDTTDDAKKLSRKYIFKIITNINNRYVLCTNFIFLFNI